MTTDDAKLRSFFQRYATASLSSQPEKLADFYDSSFLAAGPQGGAAFKNDEAFLTWLREVHDFNVLSGMSAMSVGAIREVPISDAYLLVTVEWAATFRATGDQAIRFSISYILRRFGETMKVAAYISHQDQEAAMREKGLL